MSWTDAQVEAALDAFIGHDLTRIREAMRAALEAAAQAAPAPDALPRWYNLVCARCGEDIRRRDEAAPAPKTKRKPPTRHSRRLP